MPDPLAGYHLEIFAIEDEWYGQILASREVGKPLPQNIVSPWIGGCEEIKGYWNGLREIQERHGIAWPDDSRVFSIASYQHELAGLKSRYDQSGWEHHKHQLADPETDHRPSYTWHRHEFDKKNCLARHFPRFDAEKPDDAFAPMDSLPKVWLYIGREIRFLRIKGDEPALRGFGYDPWVWQLGHAREAFVVVRKHLLKFGLDWADSLLGVQYATGDEYLDHLQSIANRLVRDEADSLSPEHRRAFGLESADATTTPDRDPLMPTPQLLAKMAKARWPKKENVWRGLEAMGGEDEIDYGRFMLDGLGDPGASPQAVRSAIDDINKAIRDLLGYDPPLILKSRKPRVYWDRDLR